MFLWRSWKLEDANLNYVLKKIGLYVIIIFSIAEYEKDLTEIIIKHDLNAQKIPFISRGDYIDLKERKQSNFKC